MATVTERKAQARIKQNQEKEQLKAKQANDTLYLRNTWTTKINDARKNYAIAREQLKVVQRNEKELMTNRHRAELAAIK